ncbi:MAG: YHYH protein [Actinomycetota bacterium]
MVGQDLTWDFPIEATFTGDAVEARVPGVAVNGVKFEPGTAETVTCESGETVRIEALQEVYDLGIDMNNAHVQPTGEYHYHGIADVLAQAYDAGEDLVHLGFAADGHLIYYSMSGAYSSGYALADEARTGTGCVASGPGGATLDLEGTAPDGTYDTDWVFDEANGDLDECNGTEIDGEYVYLITDEYPFISRCLNGEFTEEGPPAGGAPPGGAGAPPA